MTKVFFHDAKVVDTASGTMDIRNILIDNGLIAGVGYLPDEDEKSKKFRSVNLKGKIVIPAVIDSHVTLCEPRYEQVEPISSLAKAAQASGVSAVIGHPKAPVDKPELIHCIQHLSSQTNTTIFPAGTLSKNRDSKELAELGLMEKAGAVAFSDGNSPSSSTLMGHALQYSQLTGQPIVVRPNDDTLCPDGLMSDGAAATRLGLSACPAVSEVIRIERDLRLLEAYGGKLHVFPITTKASVDVIRVAKQKGLDVSAGTAPQYLDSTDQMVDGYDTNAKIWPPLRQKEDCDALIDGIKDGTIDILASDHTPVLADQKNCDFQDAEAGMSGIDTFLRLSISILHLEHDIPLVDVCKLFTKNPKDRFNLDINGIGLSSAANFTVIELKEKAKITEKSIHSLGKNTPYIGKTVGVEIIQTVSNGTF